jgi:hypothetical protein
MSLRPAIALLTLLALAAGASAQEGRVAPASISVVVEEQALGPELVEITALRPDYPADLLRRQVARLGELANSTPRGLHVATHEVGGQGPRARFLKAKFAIDNLIQRDRGVLWLQPIVQAFADAPEPFTIRTMKVQFAGESPGEGTLTGYVSEAIGLVGTVTLQPPGIEYLISLKTQDPALLTIPERHAPVPAEPAEAERARAPWAAVIGLLAVAALAAGCLVYFAALAWGRRSAAPPRRPDR